jgi:AraC family transcriptional regulator of arabinose operon
MEITDQSIWRSAWESLAEARRLLSSPARGRHELASNAVERCLLWCDEANPSHGPVADVRVRRAAEFAARNLSRPIAVAEMSQEAGLSASRLNVLFRRQLGVSPAQYAEQLRLDHAARLLSSAGVSVKEAAAASGYADPFHFSRRFRARFGYPPSHQSDH